LRCFKCLKVLPPKAQPVWASSRCGSPNSIQKRALTSHLEPLDWARRNAPFGAGVLNSGAQNRAVEDAREQASSNRIHKTPRLPQACIALARGKTTGGAEKRSSADPGCHAPACLQRLFADTTRKACILPPSPFRAVEHKTDLDRTGEEKKRETKKVLTADPTSQDCATPKRVKIRNID